MNCQNCGADKGLHHCKTMQCPVGGREAPIGQTQEWMGTTFQMDAASAYYVSVAPLKQRIRELEDLARRARIALTFYRENMWTKSKLTYPYGCDVENDIKAYLEPKNVKPEAQEPEEEGRITYDYFLKAIGAVPIQDDLNRANCTQAGEPGHWDCGWCDECERPFFMCPHSPPRKEVVEDKK